MPVLLLQKWVYFNGITGSVRSTQLIIEPVVDIEILKKCIMIAGNYNRKLYHKKVSQDSSITAGLCLASIKYKN